jgi:hypothetical protein
MVIEPSNAHKKSKKIAWHMPCKLPFDDLSVICEALMALCMPGDWTAWEQGKTKEKKWGTYLGAHCPGR